MAGTSATRVGIDKPKRKTKNPQVKHRRHNLKRRGTGRLVRELREAAFFEAMDLPRIAPVDALNEALTRSIAIARYASQRAGRLDEHEQWVERDRDKDTGTVLLLPHAWIAEEQKCWERVAWLAARMTQLGIEDRSVRAKEQMSNTFAIALQSVAEQLNLTKEQRAQLPTAVRTALPAVQEG